MKNYAKLFILGIMALATTLTGCKDPVEETTPIDGATITLATAGTLSDGAVIQATTTIVKELAYTVSATSEEQQMPSAEELFTNGTIVAVEEDGTTSITLSELEADTNYTIYVAGRYDEQWVVSQVESLSFITEMLPPQMSAEIVSTSTTTAEIKLTTTSISRYAYMVLEVADDGSVEGAPSMPSVLFVKGITGDCANGDTTIELEKLQPASEYNVYFAGEIAGQDEFMEEILVLEGVVTEDFTEDVRVYDIDYNGFTVDLRVDESLKEVKHAIKYASIDLFYYHYNVLHNGSPNNTDDYLMWNQRSAFEESTTFEVRSSEIKPGQPQVLIMAEYRWGKFGGEWFYAFPYDYDALTCAAVVEANPTADQSSYWGKAFYYNEIIYTTQPDALNEEIKYTLEMETNEAVVTFEENDNILSYCVGIIPETEYQNMMTCLRQNEDLRQWFMTSASAFENGYSKSLNPKVRNYISLSDFQHEDQIVPGVTYHLMVTAIGGDVDAEGLPVGNKQTFIHETFTLPDYTKPAPTVEVTPSTTTPTSVAFNIKCTSGDADKVYVLANYKEEWDLIGTSLETVREYMAAYGSQIAEATILDAINGPNGYDLSFSSDPYKTTMLAVKVVNDEGLTTYVLPVANTAQPEEKDEPVEIPALDGEWTMTASVAHEKYTDETQTASEWITEQVQGKVIIGNDFAADVPESLTEDVYAIFEAANVSREDADTYYEEFKAELAQYIEYTVEGQNRILCCGWDMDPTGNFNTSLASPYELFCATSDKYNGQSSVAPVYDFGPKWYLEFDQAGNVFMPYNPEYFGFMSSWTFTYSEDFEMNIINTYSLVAANQKYNYVNFYSGSFPVEISEDLNTITIKGVEDTATGESLYYYPNMMFHNSFNGNDYITGYSYVVSDIVLTRGYTEPAEPAEPAQSSKQQRVSADGMPKAKTYMPRARFR